MPFLPSVGDSIHFFYFHFFLGPIQSEIFAEGFTESDSVVVKYSVADTQWKRIWQNEHVVIARVRWMDLNITRLCRWNYVVWYVLFYGYDLEWLEIQSHEHEHSYACRSRCEFAWN